MSRRSTALHAALGAPKKGSEVRLTCCQSRIEHIAERSAKIRYIRQLSIAMILRVASSAILPRLLGASGQEACFEVAKSTYSGRPGTASACPFVGLSIDPFLSGESRCSVGIDARYRNPKLQRAERYC